MQANFVITFLFTIGGQFVNSRSRSSFILVISVLLVACGSAQQPTGAARAEAPPAPESPAATQPELVEVASSERQWTGVAVSPGGRIFVNYPRWSDDVPISVAELGDDGAPLPFPTEEWNTWTPGDPLENRWVAVQSVVCDTGGHLWVLDTGNPGFAGVIEGAPKLIEVNLSTNSVVRQISFAAPSIESSSYLNDVRITPDRSRAYITDSGDGALVVVDLEAGTSRRVLADHPSTQAEEVTLTIGGQPWLRGGAPPQVHADGIALDADGSWLYYQALTGRHLYRVPTDALDDASLSAEELAARVEQVAASGASDGLLFADGRVYISALEEDAVRAWSPDAGVETVVQDVRIAWPDSFALGANGDIYFTTSLIHLGPSPEIPYRIYRFRPGTL